MGDMRRVVDDICLVVGPDTVLRGKEKMAPNGHL